jgi:hypothetical protein
MKTEYIILCENRGDYITSLEFKPDGKFDFLGGPAHEAIRYTLAQATEVAENLGRGFAVEPAFALTRSVSSTGPIYRGEYQAWRIEAAADLNSFQVIDEASDCDTFKRDGADFEEKHSSGVTQNWSEDDFKTVINEINRLAAK